jgi:hypothetical protein
MKLTREGKTRPLISLTSYTSGSGDAPSGQVIVSTGSNGGTAWGSNVSHIYSNGSNHLAGPFVNFQSGSNIIFSVASNTLTISSTGGGSVGDFLTTTGGGGDVISTVASSGSTETINLANGNVHDVTLTDDCTFTFTPPAAGRGRAFSIWLRQGSGAPHLATWPGSVVWPGGSAPTLSTAENDVDVLHFATLDGGTVWYGFPPSGGSSVGSLDDLSDVTITAPAEDDDLRYNGSVWVNDARKWEVVTDGEDVLVWVSDDLVYEWST